MVVGFVLELQQPFFGFAVHIHVHEDAAGVVLFAAFHVVQETLGTEVAGTDGGQFHHAEAFVLAAEFLADGIEVLQ